MKTFYQTEKKENNWTEGDLGKQIFADYISGMTDKFAIESMKEISIPKPACCLLLVFSSCSLQVALPTQLMKTGQP